MTDPTPAAQFGLLGLGSMALGGLTLALHVKGWAVPEAKNTGLTMVTLGVLWLVGAAVAGWVV